MIRHEARRKAVVDQRILQVLREVVDRLKGKDLNWAVVGSMALAVRGARVEPHDIDIMTDERSAYEIERIFSESVTRIVELRTSDQIRSHFGALEIDGVKVEIMGDYQHRQSHGGWDEPADLPKLVRWVSFEGMRIPVLRLDWSLDSYSKLGRAERVEIIRDLMNSGQT